MRKELVLGVSTALALSVAAPAVGQQPGQSGTWALGADRLFGVSYSTDTREAGGIESSTSLTTVGLLGSWSFASMSGIPRLSVDTFVGPGISLGGSLMYVMLSPSSESDGQSSDDNAAVNLFVVSPRVGYAVMFNQNFGIWPRAGITYGHIWSEYETVDVETGETTTSDSSNSSTQLNLEAMLILSPAPHVGLTLGPTFDYELGRTDEDNGDNSLAGVSTSFTSIGLQAGLLAWF